MLKYSFIFKPKNILINVLFVLKMFSLIFFPVLLDLLVLVIM